MIDLIAIRARDEDDYATAEVLRNIQWAGNTDPELTATINMVADRHALLAAYDALAAENAALKAQLAYAASTGDECAIEVESLRKDAERLRVAFFELYRDWKGGDFVLPPLAALDVQAIYSIYAAREASHDK